ncbi:unnamed protein product [Cunninghamella blakesleeana]
MAQTTKVIGELAVVALKARDLPNREIVGKQDPFCVFRLGEDAKKTKTDYRGGQYPIWDDQVNLMVPEGKTKMRVQIFDEDAKKEDLISETDLDLTEVIKEGEQDGWFQLMFKGRKAGEIYLELTFYSARPPPRRQPTRYKGAYTRPQSYQQPPPPLPNSNYPPSTGRPLPPAPTTSTSTPSTYSGVGPKPYVPPPPAQNPHQQHIATPHMPQSLNPQPRPSNSTGYPPTSSAHSTPNPNHHSPYPPPSSHQHPPPQNNGSFYPPSTNPPPSNGSNASQPLLSAPFRPGHSPQNSVSGQQNNNHGYPPPSHGYNQQQSYPPVASSYPPSSQPQYGNFSTPLTASATPYGGASTPVPPNSNTLGFPQPQRHSGSFNSPFPTPQQPFAAAQPPPSHYPPSTTGGGYPPQQQGYPPNPNSGYPPQQHGYPPQQNQQHVYPPQQNQHHGYPPYPPQ